MSEDDAEIQSIQNVTTVVHGVILGVEMPFPLQNPNACLDSGLTCPLEKSKEFEYVQTLPVLRSYPKVIYTFDIEQNHLIFMTK